MAYDKMTLLYLTYVINEQEQLVAFAKPNLSQKYILLVIDGSKSLPLKKENVTKQNIHISGCKKHIKTDQRM